MPKWLYKIRLAMYIKGNIVARFCNHYAVEMQQCVFVFCTIHC